MLIRLAFTRKKLAIAWVKVLDLLLATNCWIFFTKFQVRANQAIARFILSPTVAPFSKLPCSLLQLSLSALPKAISIIGVFFPFFFFSFPFFFVLFLFCFVLFCFVFCFFVFVFVHLLVCFFSSIMMQFCIGGIIFDRGTYHPNENIHA